jgi:uncharacterized membrane-anchored protein YhcB (DUF1043 family)
MSNITGNTLLALLTGAAIGALELEFYLLWYQKQIRIKDGYKVTKKDLKNKYENLSNYEEKLNKSKFDLETYEDILSNMSHKTEDVISFLETKWLT